MIRVVDNQSDDGTLEIAQRHATADTRVRFIANPDNPGFGVACNQGAADALAAKAILPFLRRSSASLLKRNVPLVESWTPPPTRRQCPAMAGRHAIVRTAWRWHESHPHGYQD